MSAGASILLWLKAMRAPFFSASAMSVVVGSAAAWGIGAPISAGLFLVTFVGVVALHGGANLANDYFDHLSGNDAANVYFNPFSGGSRFIQDGVIPAKRYLTAAYVSFGVAFVCGAAIYIERGGWKIPLLAFAGLFAGYLYTSPSARLGYRGVGEAVVGVTFGPLVTMGSYCVQTYRDNWASFWCGVPVGLLVALILLVNEFPDIEADTAAAKKTLVVRLGVRKATILSAALYALTYFSMWVIVDQGLAPRGALWTFVTIPIAIFVVAWLWRHGSSPRELQPSSGAHIVTHFLFTAILATAYILARR